MADLSVGETRLWSTAGFEPDPWLRAEAAQPGRPTLLALPAWVEAMERASIAPEMLAVELQPADPTEPLLPYLDRVPLIALAFPAFTDGRSYSRAGLLRRRHAYRGLLRATGDVLFDQIPLMLRMGFDQFAISHGPTLARLDAGAQIGSARHYQPAPVSGHPAAGVLSWRRHAQQESIS